MSEQVSVQERLTQDLKTAMKAKDQVRVNVIRGARAALQQAQLEADKQRYDEAARQIAQQHAGDQAAIDAALNAMSNESLPLDETAQQRVLMREAKKRRDSAQTYRAAGHNDRAAEEENEAAILETYLPAQLTPDELRPQVAALISQQGFSGPGDMNKLMPLLMAQYQGRADGKMLSQIARELLSNG